MALWQNRMQNIASPVCSLSSSSHSSVRFTKRLEKYRKRRRVKSKGKGCVLINHYKRYLFVITKSWANWLESRRISVKHAWGAILCKTQRSCVSNHSSLYLTFGWKNVHLFTTLLQRYISIQCRGSKQIILKKKVNQWRILIIGNALFVR